MNSIFRYVLNRLIGFQYNNSVSTKEYIYQRNALGDIIGIFDDEGKQVGGYAYDAYGNCEITVGKDEEIAPLNPFRYRGYFWDNDAKLYYLNSRYYDSETGRFISADTLAILDETKGQINGLNLYAYCGNNPVNRYDPTGYFWDWILDLLFIGWDIYNLIANEGWKDWRNWVALVVDIAFAVVPFATNSGNQIVKIANVGDDISDLNKIVVVGENMSRVTIFSSFLNATDNMYDGFKAYDRLKSLGKGGKALAEISGKVGNANWLYWKLRKGYTIIDIGIDIERVSRKTGKAIRSSNYLLERILLIIWKYRNIWKLPYHIFREG